MAPQAIKEGQSLNELLEIAVRSMWEEPFLADYKGMSYSGKDIAEQMEKIQLAFKICGVSKGDKVALVGKNSVHWAIVYLAVISYGAVIVPILPDFKAEDTHHIINHSDAVVLFISDQLFENIDQDKISNIRGIFKLQDFSALYCQDEQIDKHWNEAQEVFKQNYPQGMTPDDVQYARLEPDDLTVLSYTSGTTGFSKGVMLPYRSLQENVLFARHNMPLDKSSKIVSFLPLAHAYGCAFEFLFPFTLGCFITFLGKTPTPNIIIQAFGEMKPKLILSVPLVIEKIYRKQILPQMENPRVKFLLSIPRIKNLVYKKIRSKISEAFGGNFVEIIIGGAALNRETEIFFHKIKFPYTVGYGMTECGPLISYASWDTTKLSGAGRPVDALEVTIDSMDPHQEVGEILVKGSHVMLGYYKNPEATKQMIDDNGWLHTGDLGIMDDENNIFIKGRKKTMILGASGQNIYPEEIEALLNNLPYVERVAGSRAK